MHADGVLSRGLRLRAIFRADALSCSTLNAGYWGWSSCEDW
jgi:hypothetical protein